MNLAQRRGSLTEVGREEITAGASQLSANSLGEVATEAGRMAANHLGTLKWDERELVEEQQTARSQPQLPAAVPPLRESLWWEVGGQ